MLSLANPRFVLTGGSGFFLALSIKGRIGISFRDKTLVFMTNLWPTYTATMSGRLIYDETKDFVFQLPFMNVLNPPVKKRSTKIIKETQVVNG